jgi:hypothetical protein
VQLTISEMQRPLLEWYSPALYEPRCWGEGAASKSNSAGGHTMKMEGPGMWIEMTVLAAAVSLLATPISHAQTLAGISRVGWLEV